jgi:hypothetical protein
VLTFVRWMEESGGSVALRESVYMYPLIESAHVLTLCLFVGLASLLDLRLLGLALTSVPASRVIDRYMPFMQVGFAIMVVTGLLLFYAIPVRSYQSVWFRAKAIMLVLAGLNALLFHSRVFRRIREWDTAAVPPRAARAAGGLSLFFWAAIIVSGRFIAYSWFDCPNPLFNTKQSAFVEWAAGCDDPGSEELARR